MVVVMIAVVVAADEIEERSRGLVVFVNEANELDSTR